MKRTLISLVVVFSSSTAFATEETDKARAAGLFAEAQALSEAGNYAEACPKFEASLELRAGVGTQFNLADCWEKLGRTASAHAMFLRVVDETQKLGQAEREEAARARAEALVPRLSRVRVEVSEPAQDQKLHGDDKLIDKSVWGQPLPIDPGKHELRASAPGKKTWSNEFEVPEASTLLVNVPKLADEDARVAPVAAVMPERLVEKPTPAPMPVEVRDEGRNYTLPIVLAGVGAAGIIGGLAMTAQYVASHQDAQAVCPDGVGCTLAEIRLHDELVNDARTARTWAFIGVGAGAAALAGAAFFYFSAPSDNEQPGAGGLGAGVFVSEAGSVGAALRGGF